ncbi:hypothetical protein Bhyg_11762, partial [Pseudolycoriella hygida]
KSPRSSPEPIPGPDQDASPPESDSFVVLSSDISEGDATEAFQMQVDEILAKLTRWNSVEEDYDFTLERSLVAQ